VNTAQCHEVDLQAQLGAEGADRCFGIEDSIFAAPHTPNFRLLSYLEPDRGTWLMKTPDGKWRDFITNAWDRQ
jgi:hypothetical protein